MLQIIESGKSEGTQQHWFRIALHDADSVVKFVDEIVRRPAFWRVCVCFSVGFILAAWYHNETNLKCSHPHRFYPCT